MSYLAYMDLLALYDSTPTEFQGSSSAEGENDPGKTTNRMLGDRYRFNWSFPNSDDDLRLEYILFRHSSEEILYPFGFRYLLVGMFNVFRNHSVEIGSPLTEVDNPFVELPPFLGGTQHDLYGVVNPAIFPSAQDTMDNGINYWRLIDLGEYKTMADYNASPTNERLEIHIPKSASPGSIEIGRIVAMPAIRLDLDDDSQAMSIVDYSKKQITRSGGFTIDKRAVARTWSGRSFIDQSEIYGPKRATNQTPTFEQAASFGHMLQREGINGQLFFMPSAIPGMKGPNDSPSDKLLSHFVWHSSMVCNIANPPNIQSMDAFREDENGDKRRVWICDFTLQEELP